MESSHAAETANQKPSWMKGQFPTGIDLLVFLGIFLLAQVVGLAVALFVGCSLPDAVALASEDQAIREAAQFSTAHFNAICYVVAMSFTLVGFLLYRSRRRAPQLEVHLSARGLNPALLLWGVCFMVATSVVLEPLMALLPDVPNVYGRGVWAFLTLVVMAPLFEEVIFRGIILESARMKYGVMGAWLISSLIFGIVHGHPTVIVNAFFIGLILGFIYLRSGSLWSSIILHAINNGIAYVMLLWVGGNMMIIDLVGSRTLYVLIYIAAAAIFVISGYMMLRKLRSLKEAEKNQPQA